VTKKGPSGRSSKNRLGEPVEKEGDIMNIRTKFIKNVKKDSVVPPIEKKKNFDINYGNSNPSTERLRYSSTNGGANFENESYEAYKGADKIRV
jgi:hypothetical protein